MSILNYIEEHKSISLEHLRKILSNKDVNVEDAIYSVDYAVEALQLVVEESSCTKWEELLIGSNFLLQQSELNSTCSF